MNFSNFGIILLTLISIFSYTNASTCRSWIDDPCNTQITENSCRTKRSDYFITVKYQIKIFVMQLHLSLKKIRHLYFGIDKSGSTDMRTKLRWLNVKRMMLPIKDNSELQILEKFFHDFQKFASTMVVLQNVTVDPGSVFFNEERRKIYTVVLYQMRSLLCEVHYSLQVENEEAPKELPSRFMNIPPLEKRVDKGTGYSMDETFFKKALIYSKRMQRLMFKKPGVKMLQRKGI